MKKIMLFLIIFVLIIMCSQAAAKVNADAGSNVSLNLGETIAVLDGTGSWDSEDCEIIEYLWTRTVDVYDY